ncbi:unnamed protein product [Closterium sp. NIES-54]
MAATIVLELNSGNSITSGPVRANRTVSSGSRCRRDIGRVIEKGYSVLRITLKKELQVVNPHVKANRTPFSIKGKNIRASHSGSSSSSSSSSSGSRSSRSSRSSAGRVSAAQLGGAARQGGVAR